MKAFAIRLLPVAVLVVGVGIGLTLAEFRKQGGGASQAADAAEETGPANQSAKPPCCPTEAEAPERHGLVIGLKREVLDEYVDLHKPENVWPGITKLIRDCNIRNYSIYLAELNDGNLYLFAYFEYHGDDFEADMEKMSQAKVMNDWWELTDPMQIPQKNRKEGEHWMEMEEVFHQD
jgi:L-rhamnose mutarotase